MSARFIIVVLAAVAASMTFGDPATARSQSPEEAAAMDHMVNPQVVVLTEDQVKRYVGFLKDNKIALKKIGDVQGNPEAVDRALDEANAVPAKHGFNRLGDFIDIRWTIDGIASRFNNALGVYIDPIAKHRKVLEQREAEPLNGKSAEEIAEHQRDIQFLKETGATLKPDNPENVALVGKYINEILASR